MHATAFEVVGPTSIERQKVETCLRVFCDKTISALKLHPEIKEEKGRIYFLNAVIEFWKIINVHSKFTAPQTRDNLRTVIQFSLVQFSRFLFPPLVEQNTYINVITLRKKGHATKRNNVKTCKNSINYIS